MASTLLRTAALVRQARSAGEAKRVALDWLPQVILLDVRLAGESGYATARQIHERWPPDRELPRLVMVSADPPEASHVLENGAQAHEFLLKPFSARQLLNVVQGTSRPALPATGSNAREAENLQRLFRTELAGRLEALDLCLSRPDVLAARSILHQLIASSALCQQHRLERDLRRLYAACHGPIEASALARGYYALLASARDYAAVR